MVDISIIIVSYNTKDLLLRCLESIKKYTKEIEYEIVVVDNASRDNSIVAISKLKALAPLRSGQNSKLKLIENKENRGFAAANNQGIKIAKGRYILLLNSDTELAENSLLTMVSWMDDHLKVGIASCQLSNPDQTIQATGGFFPTLTRVFLWATLLDDLPFVADLAGSYHPHPPTFWTKSRFYTKERQLDWATGAFFLIRREVIEEIGFFDEDFFLYVEEVEYCLRAKKKGWQVWYVPKTQIIHYGGASGTKEGTILREFEGLKLFYKKHYPTLLPFLRILLFLGSLVRVVIFAIINQTRAKMYVSALCKS